LPNGNDVRRSRIVAMRAQVRAVGRDHVDEVGREAP